MRYTRTIDIWEFPRELIKYLQAGQWVRAGQSDSHKGRFCGITQAGVIMIDWSHKPANFKRKLQVLKGL